MKCHWIFGCHEVPLLGWISGAGTYFRDFHGKWVTLAALLWTNQANEWQWIADGICAHRSGQKNRRMFAEIAKLQVEIGKHCAFQGKSWFGISLDFTDSFSLRFPAKIKVVNAKLDTKLDGFVHAQEPCAIDMEPCDRGNIRCALRVSARWCPDCCTVWLPA